MTIYRPGERVPVSGIYNVVTATGAYAGRQDTCEQGDTFPPTRRVGEYGYTLHKQTVHVS
jgi:hypothetical protein